MSDPVIPSQDNTSQTGIGKYVLNDSPTLISPTLINPITTGTQTIENLTATGNMVLGDTSSDALTVNATAAFENGLTIGSSTADTVTINSKLVITGTETIAAGGTSTALDLTKFHHDIDADAGGDTFTLANGVQGQITVCVLKTATGVATITPATFLGGTSVTLNAAGESVMFRFQNTLGWSVIGGNGYTIV